MSDVRSYAIAMVLMGAVGVVSMLLYLAMYSRLTPELIPLSHRRRVASWRRKAPSVLLFSTAATGVGLAVLAL